jgi:glyoxylase-like metal-dependent hydrolase (beta-lactamase superfamily II)
MKLLLRRWIPTIRERRTVSALYSRGMDVLEIAPGLWRWTGYHEEWREDVGCVYCETEDGVVLVDPLVPPEDAERFWRALDRDVRRLDAAVHVLVTVCWHTRSTAAMVERYDARVWAPRRARAAVARRAGVVTDSFGPGDRLPGGIEARPTVRGGEVVYWLPRHAALVPGDVLLGDGRGGVRMCPESWLPRPKTHADLTVSLQPLLDLAVERILLSHGDPILSEGSKALAEALGNGARTGSRFRNRVQ